MKKNKILLGLATAAMVIGGISFFAKAPAYADPSTGYECYLPKGYTEIRDILLGSFNESYVTRGTVSRIVKTNNGTIFFLQRTNGNDGSKSCLMAFSDGEDANYLQEQMVVDISGTYKRGTGNSPVFEVEDTIVVVEEMNTSPIEEFDVTNLESDSYQNKSNYNRLVSLNNVILSENGGEYYVESEHSSIPLNYISDALEYSAILNKIQNAPNNSIVNVTGILTGNYELSGDISDYEIKICKSSDFVAIPNESNLKSIQIYASNDFHGAIEGGTSGATLKKFGTYFKQRGEEANTLLLDQGDTWQGSVYSNFNHGACINDVMNYAKFDARTIGNHDFDWGIETLEANKLATYNGYSTPVLAANVYDFNFQTKEVGTTQQSSIGEPSIVTYLENGIKVGIVGTIGKNQITSIDSGHTQNVTFIDHRSVIRNEAQRLKEEEYCDIVIACSHSGASETYSSEYQGYVDLVLCGHTHSQENVINDGITYVQCSANGGSFGHITLTYDCSTNEVTNTSVDFISGNSLNNQVTSVDPVIDSIVDRYHDECSTEADVVVANNVSTTFNKSADACNLVTTAMLDLAIEEGYDVDFAVSNTGRANLPSGSWTYADIYQTFPFDNKIYIMEVSGSELKNEVKDTNYFTRNPKCTENFEEKGTYTIACLDYLANHTNSSRYYDYFSEHGGTHKAILSKNYRVCLRDWLIKNGYSSGKELSKYDFSSNSWNHNRNDIIFSAEPLPEGAYVVKFLMNDGTDTTYFEYTNYAVDNLEFPYNNPSREGYTFTGWYYDEEATMPASEEDITLGEVSIYAGWESKGNALIGYFITLNDGFNEYGWIGSSYDVYSVEEPKRLGYTFTGWYFDSLCTELVEENVILTEYQTFYAGWEEIIETRINSGKLDFNTFVAGTTSTEVEIGDLTYTFSHSEIVDQSSYSEFGIGGYGYLTAYAPEGYIITSIEIMKYNRYNNFVFYNSSGEELSQDFKPSETSKSQYFHYVDVNDTSVRIENTYSGTVSIYYITIYVEEIN